MPDTTTVRELPARLRALSPGWWGAVAGAAAAGATVFHQRRVLAGALGAVGMLAIALWRETPCCASCADAPGPTVPDVDAAPVATRVETWRDDYGLASTTAGQKGCTG